MGGLATIIDANRKTSRAARTKSAPEVEEAWPFRPISDASLGEQGQTQGQLPTMRPTLMKLLFDEEGNEILATGLFPLIAGGYDRDATRVLDEVLVAGQIALSVTNWKKGSFRPTAMNAVCAEP